MWNTKGKTTGRKRRQSTMVMTEVSEFSAAAHHHASPAVGGGTGGTGGTGLHVLICGWRRDIKDMLTLLDRTLPPHSEVHILSDHTQRFFGEYVADNLSDENRLRSIVAKHHTGDSAVRRRLVAANGSETFDIANDIDIILVVVDAASEKDVLLCDSHTIASSLLIRDVQAGAGGVPVSGLGIRDLEALHKRCPVIGEVLDVSTRSTIDENPAIHAIADYVVVNDLAARLIASIADRREVSLVLNELLSPSGQDMFVVTAATLLHDDELCVEHSPACIDVGDGKPAGNNVHNAKGAAAKPVTFAEVALRARELSRCICLGYIKRGYHPNAPQGIGEPLTVLNPDGKAAPLFWHADDYLVMLGVDRGGAVGIDQGLVVVR